MNIPTASAALIALFLLSGCDSAETKWVKMGEDIVRNKQYPYPEKVMFRNSYYVPYHNNGYYKIENGGYVCGEVRIVDHRDNDLGFRKYMLWTVHNKKKIIDSGLSLEPSKEDYRTRDTPESRRVFLSLWNSSCKKTN